MTCNFPFVAAPQPRCNVDAAGPLMGDGPSVGALPRSVRALSARQGKPA
jgi:hypothetical protein